MAACTKWVFFVGVHTTRALLFGVYMRPCWSFGLNGSFEHEGHGGSQALKLWGPTLTLTCKPKHVATDIIRGIFEVYDAIA